MSISYNKLWKSMIDLNINKTQLRKVAGLSTNIIARLSKNQTVSMDTLLRICNALHCNIGDIVDVVDESDQHWSAKYPLMNEPNLLRVAEDSTSTKASR